MITSFAAKDIKDEVSNQEAEVISHPYFVVHSPTNEDNLTVLVTGKNGNEFNKTAGLAYTYAGVVVYRCLYGHGILLIQRNNETGDAKDIRFVGLRPGVEVEVPSGYLHCLVNTGKNFLVTMDNAPREAKFKNNEASKAKRGLAYYVIDKKGDIAFEKNHNYSFHPQISNY